MDCSHVYKLWFVNSEPLFAGMVGSESYNGIYIFFLLGEIKWTELAFCFSSLFIILGSKATDVGRSSEVYNHT